MSDEKQTGKYLINIICLFQIFFAVVFDLNQILVQKFM